MSKNPTWEAWWGDMYKDYSQPTEYPGGSESYILAGEFLKGDDLVEEWGCATTWGKQFIPAPYRGVDGAPSGFVDVIADLKEYRSNVPKALMRHVLEHNWEWRTILDNFLGSFREKAVIILFIPLGLHDINRSFEHRVGEPSSPPGLQMDESSFFDKLDRMGMEVVRDTELINDTPPFGYERLFFLEKDLDQIIMPHLKSRPKCVRCGKVGYEVLRADYTLLDNRYEIAYNYCSDCLWPLLNGMYSLEKVPEVTWKDR